MAFLSTIEITIQFVIKRDDSNSLHSLLDWSALTIYYQMANNIIFRNAYADG